jgi:hypothetical protein
LRASENKVLRRLGLSEHKRNEMAGGWRKVHHDDVHDLYSSPSTIIMFKSRRVKWIGDVARMGENINAYSILVGKREGKRALGRPGSRWEDSIKTTS